MGLPSIPPPPPRRERMSPRPGLRPISRPVPQQMQGPPKIRPQNRTQPVSLCRCGRDILLGFRFCDRCGAPLGYTGKTERLDQ